MKERMTIDQQERNANIYTSQCIITMAVITSICTILNFLNIFIVEDYLMISSCVCGIIGAILSTIIVKFFNHSTYTKYALLIDMEIIVTVIGIMLSYHTILIFIFPILCAAQYKRKKTIIFSYIASVLSVFITVIIGYYVGLCDANMLLLTAEPTSHYVDPLTGKVLFTMANSNPNLTIPLYFAFPRCLIMFAIVPTLGHMSDVITTNAIREQELKALSEMDTMTNLYNKNKYIEMEKEYYPHTTSLGVIFFDVNDLKQVNDNMGHEYGDYLITSIASIISENIHSDAKGYRIGGDEFVVVWESATEDDIIKWIDQCRNGIALRNKMSMVHLSVAIGYALGAGSDIENVVKEADNKMYENKKAIKSGLYR